MIRPVFTATYAKALLKRWKQVVTAILSVLGFVWMSVEILTFFLGKSFRASLLDAGWLLFLATSILGVILALPKLKLTMKHLTDSDLKITIQAKDIFNTNGLIVVPTNTEFDMILNGIAVEASSVMGALIRNEYSSNAKHLQSDVNDALKKNGEKRKSSYPPGTCLKIVHGAKTFIILATDPLNANRRSQGDYLTGDIALSALWKYLGDNADRTTIAIPLIGTGRSRIANLSRMHAVKRIVKSFLISSSERAFCDHLLICIQPRDFTDHYFDLNTVKIWAYSVAEYQREARSASQS